MSRRKITIAVIVAALVDAGSLAWYFTHRTTTLSFSGTIETREIQVGSKVGGRLINVAVEEGQQVKAGTPLVRFEATNFARSARPGPG